MKTHILTKLFILGVVLAGYEIYGQNCNANSTAGNLTVCRIHTLYAIDIGYGGTGATTAAGALANILPTTSGANKALYWNGSAYVWQEVLTAADMVPTGQIMTESAANAAIATIESEIAVKADATSVYTKSESDALYKAIGYVPAWSEITSKPSTFPPSSHAHIISDVTGLQGALDGKQASLGFTPYNSTNPSGYISGINSGMVTTALGFTPYNTTNPAGYISAEVDGSVTNEIELPTQTGQSGKVLTTNGSSPSWTTAATGTVTSIGLSSTDLTVSGSPVTGSGTLTVNLTNSGVSAGSYGAVTVTAKGIVTAGKRLQLFSGTTDGSGNYTATFGTTYATPPNIQASITNQSNNNQFIRVSSVTTTGFTINVFQRSAVTLLAVEVLLAAVTNVSGATVDVLVTEK